MHDAGRLRTGGGGANGAVRDVVAILDDEPLALRALQRILATDDHTIVTALQIAGLAEWIADPALAVVLLDLFMGDGTGLEGLERLKRERPDVEVIVMTGRASVESAVHCMRAGAFDYLCKPFADIDRVRATVRAARAFAVLESDTGEAERMMSVSSIRSNPSESDWFRVPLVAERAPIPTVPLSLEAYERLALERALWESAGDAQEAARRLGIGRSTYYRKAAKLGVDLQRRDDAAEPLASNRPVTQGGRVGGGSGIG